MNRGAQESQFKKSSLGSQAEIQEEEFLATRAEQAIVPPPGVSWTPVPTHQTASPVGNLLAFFKKARMETL